MSLTDLLKELLDLPPTTAYEFLYWAMLTLLGIVILFKPTGILWIENIDPKPILNQPGWVGLLLILGAPNLLLLTKFGKWVRQERNKEFKERV